MARAKAAGIRPMMITGDHPKTAAVIAAELGIADKRAGGHRRGARPGCPKRPLTERSGRCRSMRASTRNTNCGS